MREGNGERGKRGERKVDSSTVTACNKQRAGPRRERTKSRLCSRDGGGEGGLYFRTVWWGGGGVCIAVTVEGGRVCIAVTGIFLSWWHSNMIMSCILHTTETA